tara:strand:- start:1240 stop:1686 length:447 start_codon:yes stop_codon:yes gene_type:complete
MDQHYLELDIEQIGSLKEYLDTQGLENLLSEEQNSDYAFSLNLKQLREHLPEVSRSEDHNYNIDFLSYFINEKGAVIQITPHYNMPWRDFLQGVIFYAETEGPHVIYIKQQAPEDTAKTGRHELMHSHEPGSSEARVTYYANMESDDL